MRGEGPVASLDDAQRMLGSEDHRVAAVEAEGDAALAALALDAHLDRAEGGASTSMSSFSTGVTRTWRPSGSRRSTVENSRTIAGRRIGAPS